MIKTEEVTSKVIEPAKTGRSKCKICNNTIEKNSLRVGVSYSEQSGQKWFHLTCFPLKELITSAEELEGYTTLNEDEQNSVKNQMDVVVAPIRSASIDKFVDPTNLEELGETVKNEISAIKSKMEEIKPVTAEKLRELLVENGQYSAGTKGELLVRAADVIVRGAIPKCSKCEKGFLFWSENTQDYFCKGYTDEEGKAQPCDGVFSKEQINRTPIIVTENLFQKKERKRKVTVTTVIEKMDEKKEEVEEEEEDTGLRKKRKSAGIRKWSDDFIYEKDNSEGENSQEGHVHPPLENQQLDQNEEIHQNNQDQQEPPLQQNPPSNYFNTVINNYDNNNNNNQPPPNYYNNNQYYPNEN